MKEWKENIIKNLGVFFSNNTFSRDCLNYNGGAIQNVHYGDVLITFSDILNANNSSIPYINENEKVVNDFFVKDGDIIVADTAEDETVGKVCEIRNVGNRKIVSGLHTLWFRPNSGEFAPNYLAYLLNSFGCHKQLIRKAHGIKVLSINKGDFWRTIVKYPPIPEQQAIAGIIRKVDQCIECAQKSIEKTQRLKKALMQNLLTGKMKIDGTLRKDAEFYDHPKLGKVPRDWSVNRLKDLFTIKAGGDLKEEFFSPQKTENECHPIFANSLEKNGLYGYTSKPLFPANTLTITGRGYLGHVEYRSTDYDAIVRLNVLIPKPEKKIFVKFFAPLIEQTVHFVNESTGVPQLTAPAIKIQYVVYPKNVHEQESISNVLDLFEEKINKKNEKLETLQRLKKSLMQNLLTGKKRIDVEKINLLLAKMN